MIVGGCCSYFGEGCPIHQKEPKPPQTPESGEWYCFHNGEMDGQFYKFRCDSDWKFCPVCGAQKPTLRSALIKCVEKYQLTNPLELVSHIEEVVRRFK